MPLQVRSVASAGGQAHFDSHYFDASSDPLFASLTSVAIADCSFVVRDVILGETNKRHCEYAGVSVGNAFNGGSGGGSSSSSSGGIAGSHSFGLSSGGAVGGGVGLGSTWVHRPRLALYGAPG